jgi:predicted membrane channel-forming protein YqfA (hemolysin III family)
MDRSLNVRLIVACLAFIVFLFGTLAAGIAQVWPLFLVGVVLTAASVAYALVTGEWWRTATERETRRSRRGGASSR